MPMRQHHGVIPPQFQYKKKCTTENYNMNLHRQKDISQVKYSQGPLRLVAFLYSTLLFISPLMLKTGRWLADPKHNLKTL